MNRILAVFFCCLLLSSCSDEALMDERADFNQQSWDFENKISFNFEAKDTSQKVDIYMLFRTSIDYPYSNMFVFMETEMPDKSKDTDTLQFILAKPSGEWLGNRVGNTVEFEIPVSQGVKFPQNGKYVFSFQHGMQDEVLPEILDFGLRIEPINP